MFRLPMDRRTHITIAAIASLALALGSDVARADPSAGLDLANKMSVTYKGYQGETAEVTMTLVNQQGGRATRRMKLVSRETAGDGDKSRVEFVLPADVKGTRMLTWSHKRGADDQWLYLPVLKRVKRISGSNISGSFMGSEFAYEDLSSQEVDKFTYNLLGADSVDSRPCHKLERRPVNPDSGYSKQIVWVDDEYLSPVKVEYYDRKEELLKVAQYTGYAKVGRWWRAAAIEVVNQQTGKRSTLEWSDRKLQVPLSEGDFTKDALEQ